MSNRGSNKTSRNWRRGYSLVEGLLGLAILAAVIVGVSRFLTQSAETEEARMTATRWSEMSIAADNYIKAYDGQISAALTSAATVLAVPLTTVEAGTLPVTSGGLPDFQSAGFLGVDFQDKNRYGQKTALLLLTPPGASKYEAFLVSFGGEAMPDVILTGAEGMSEGRVGAIMNHDPQGVGFARGTRGGWVAPTTTFASLGTGVGHLVSYISLDKGGFGAENQWLSRVPDPDQDVAGLGNQMEADIDMNGSGLNNVAFLNAGTAGDGTIGQIQVAGGFDVTSGNVDVTGGDVTTDSAMVSPVYYGGTTTAPDKTHYLQPSSISLLQNVSAQQFDASTQVYCSGECGGHNFGTGVALADLLPNEVIKGSYLATDGSLVPIPTCDANGVGQPKIFAMPLSLYNAAAPTTSVTSQANFEQVPVVTGISAAGSTINVNYSLVNSVTDVESSTVTNASNMMNEMWAVSVGNAWELNIGSWTWTADGTPVRVSNPLADAPAEALVQTACFYN